MIPTRLLAAAVVILTIAGIALAVVTSDSPESTAAAQPERLTTTTGEPNFDALVAAGVVMALPEAEEALTAEALTRSTSTTTTTTPTSTTMASTTPPPAAPTSTQPLGSSNETAAPTTAPPPPDPGGGFDPSAEDVFASMINSYRASQGLASLTRDGSLDAYARAWAEQLSANGSLSHSDIGSLLPPWSSVGENVAMGGSVDGMFDALVASSGHRANMLGDYTHLGVGVWQDDDGTYWAVHVFTS